MAKKEKPRSGSMAYYPRVRAQSSVPRFNTFAPVEGEEAKVLNFLAYKAGMGHVLGVNQHKGSPSHGMTVRLPVTVLDCPPLKVFGYRFYAKDSNGLRAVFEVHTSNLDKFLARSMGKLKKEKKAKKSKGKAKTIKGKAPAKKEEPKQETKPKQEPGLEGIHSVRLLAHSHPVMTPLGKKKPDVTELFLSGSLENQLAFAKDALGKEVRASEVLEVNGFADVKSITKGHGMTGAVKRHNVKVQRPKAKTRRIVGSIGPWTPGTVMFTVARPGHMGYHNRTEYNKHVFKIGEKLESKSGLTNYGQVNNEYVIVRGSVPGPVKRAVALRPGLRKAPSESLHIEEVSAVVF